MAHSQPQPGTITQIDEMKFKKEYEPLGFGDKPSGKSVEGRRIAALKTAETRRFNQIIKERKEDEELKRS